MVCILSTEKRNQKVTLDVLQVTGLLMEKNVSSYVTCITRIAWMIIQKILHPFCTCTCCLLQLWKPFPDDKPQRSEKSSNETNLISLHGDWTLFEAFKKCATSNGRSSTFPCSLQHHSTAGKPLYEWAILARVLGTKGCLKTNVFQTFGWKDNKKTGKFLPFLFEPCLNNYETKGNI